MNDQNNPDPFSLLTKGVDNKYIGAFAEIALTFIEQGKLEEAKLILNKLMTIL